MLFIAWLMIIFITTLFMPYALRLSKCKSDLYEFKAYESHAFFINRLSFFFLAFELSESTENILIIAKLIYS